MRASARAFAVLPWLLLVLCPAVMLFLTSSAPGFGQTWISISLGGFFVVILVRLAFTFVTSADRRLPVGLLLLGVVLFAAGSAVLNGSGAPDLTHFPAPGEWLFLASYVAVAGYLLADTDRRTPIGGATWLETAVICGGTVCLAGAGLVTAAANRLQRDGLSLLLATLYPLIDVMLGVVVLGQIVLGSRGRVRDSLPLLGGFAVFAAADSTFLLHLSSGTYDYSSLSIVLWGCAFALITGHACRPRRTDIGEPSSRGLTTWVVAAGMSAAFVLAYGPDGTVRSYLLVPALATLAAAGARLVLAVREANRVAEAIALSRSDDLTGLPNRRAVLARLDEALEAAEPLGLMILDLNGFKDVNDTLGHSAGDAVLTQVAARMRVAIDPAVMIARLGGDEFAVVAPTDDEIELMEIGQAVLDAVRTQVVVDGIALMADASIGITTRQVLDASSTELLRRADVAMYDAKERRVGVLVYDPSSDEFSRERLSLGDELRRAIADRQLELWYQPQIDPDSGLVCGLEALVRWNHPVHGLTSPAEFLPAARRAGLMLSLSEEIGRIAVADLVRWQKEGYSPRVAINCAPPELMSDIFLPRLCDLLATEGISADRIVIEVTEDSFLVEPERARSILLDLNARGLQVSIDDYGTGFSSLSYLRDLPVHELKIDRSFVSTVCTDQRSKMIVASTLQMAHALGLRTVAEGVEDGRTAELLAELGVDVLQGYHLSRPLSADKVMQTRNRVYALARPTLWIAGNAG
jgi:diguanylate cyclase (GGDEF)-like protein